MLGPPKKPTDLKRFEGLRGHRAIPQNEPVYPNGLPTKPRMSVAASRIWDELVAEMRVSGVLKRVDRHALRGLSEDQAMFENVYAGLWKMTDVIRKNAKREKRELPGGEMVALLGTAAGRHAMRALRDIANRLIAERREFGLTPASRARIVVTPSERPSEWLDDVVFNRPVELLVVPKPG